MNAKSTRPSAKRDDRIARPRRAQTCELRAKRAMRMCPQGGQIFFIMLIVKLIRIEASIFSQLQLHKVTPKFSCSLRTRLPSFQFYSITLDCVPMITDAFLVSSTN